jgi:hypothetical protein
MNEPSNFPWNFPCDNVSPLYLSYLGSPSLVPGELFIP